MMANIFYSFKLLITAAINAHLYYYITHIKKPFINNIVDIAANLIAVEEKPKVLRKILHAELFEILFFLYNVGDHFPTEGSTRSRCYRCLLKQI